MDDLCLWKFEGDFEERNGVIENERFDK